MKTKTEKLNMSFSERVMLTSKISLLTLTLFLLSGVLNLSHAQNRLGIKLITGVACQSELLQITENKSLGFAYVFGVSDNIQLSEAFALQTGLEYFKRKINLDDDDTNINNTFHYLVLPALAKFSASEKAGFINGLRLYFATGPYLAYLLDAKSKESGITTGIKGDVRNYDMGFTEVYKHETQMQNKMGSVSLAFTF